MNKTKQQFYHSFPLNILYVEDDSDDQSIFREGLHEVNPEAICFTANDADEAREFLSDTPHPDVIFLDINLPKKDGLSFLKELKACEAARDIPVIVYSTSNNNSDIQKSKRLGAHEFITKPNSFRELCSILKRLPDIVRFIR